MLHSQPWGNFSFWAGAQSETVAKGAVDSPDRGLAMRKKRLAKKGVRGRVVSWRGCLTVLTKPFGSNWAATPSGFSFVPTGQLAFHTLAHFIGDLEGGLAASLGVCIGPMCHGPLGM